MRSAVLSLLAGSTHAGEADEQYSNAVLLGYCALERTEEAARELRRLWSPAATDHYVSADPAEWERAGLQGYELEGGCWVP